MSVPCVWTCRILLLACLLWGAGEAVEMENGRVVLNLGFLTSKTGGFISAGSIPAAQLALDYINNDSNILSDYFLKIKVYDDKCDATVALDSFFEHWRSTTQPSPFFFAGGCSVSSGPPGDVSRTFNTIQMANVAGSPVFSDKDRYPHFFRALPPEPGIQHAQGVVVKHFGWTEVAYIAQNEHLFAFNITDIEKFYTKTLEIPTVRTYIYPPRLPVEGLELFWTEVPRVVIINAFENSARDVLCQAYRRNFYYPNYQFIIVGWYPDEFWVAGPNDASLPCSREEFESVILRNLITVDFNFFAEDKDATGIFGLSTNTFLKLYRDKLSNTIEYDNLTETTFSATTFDAVYAAAVTMEKAILDLKDANLSLENFTFENSYESELFASILEQYLINVTFTGVSGPFEFNDEQDRDVSKADVRQWRVVNGEWKQVPIGEVLLPEREFQFINGETTASVFPEGIPQDTLSTPHTALFIFMVAVASVGIVFSIFCIVFNFAFRNKRFIKLTSPNLSYSMPLGAILLYAVVIITGIPVGSLAKSLICNIQLWLGSLGFTLIFGGILVRTWRIHYIFNHIVVSKIRKKPPKDWLLILAIGVFLLIDLAVLTVLTGVPHIRLLAIRTKLERSSSVVDICSASVDYVTVIILLLYKSVYLWVGLYLAFETRKVKVKALADSQYIAASVYVSIMTSIAIVPVAIWLRERVDIYYGLLSGILMLGLTTVLALVFLPKMIGLYKARNTDESELTANFTSGGTSKPSAMATNHSAENEAVLKLHQRVSELEEKLALYESNGNAVEEQRERKVTIQESCEAVCQPA